MSIPAWRVTCIQMPSQVVGAAANRAAAWSLINENLRCAIAMIEAAVAGPDAPDVVVLPEFAFQGPPFDGDVPRWIDLACDTIPGSITAPLQALARRLGIFIAGNQFEADPDWPGRFFNVCFLISSDGEVILRNRRINTAVWPSPHDVMDAYFERHGLAGTFPVVETRLGRIGVIACGEIAVPEVTRVLMLRGAEVILHPTNEAYSPAQEAAKISRAAENMVYIASANVAGPIGFSRDGRLVGGRSRIVDFRGRTLSHEERDVPCSHVTAMIDVEAARAARRDLGLGNTILRARFEMYRQAYATASIYPANGFADQPMTDAGQAKSLAATALERMIAAGIVT